MQLASHTSFKIINLESHTATKCSLKTKKDACQFVFIIILLDVFFTLLRRFERLSLSPFQWVCVALSVVFCIKLCKSLFVPLSFCI